MKLKVGSLKILNFFCIKYIQVGSTPKPLARRLYPITDQLIPTSRLLVYLHCKFRKIYNIFFVEIRKFPDFLNGKLQFLFKISIFAQKFRFSTKFSIFAQNVDSRVKFRPLPKISIFGQIFEFDKNFDLDKKFDSRPKFRSLPKIPIFQF